LSDSLALFLVLLLIVLNGLFVAAEFAVISARGPALDERVAAGDRRALRVAAELERLPFFLSTVQFGITATSLLVGFLADRAIGDTFVRPVLISLGVSADVTLAVSVTAALLLSTIVQMVLGELFPKNVAISRPLEVARALGGFSRMATVVLGPIVRVFDRAAEEVTRRMFRVETPSQLDDAPGLDELARIITASGAKGSLSVGQTELLRRAVSLGVRRVGEVMVPRPDVEWLQSGQSLAALVVAAARTGHSRFPVRGETEDEVLGTVHVKDLLRIPVAEQQERVVDELVAPALFVPESETLRRVLDELRRQRRTFAVVVDEFGSTAGIVTLEDVLEALVGDIEDEFDRRSRRPLGGDRIPGSTTVGRFTERFDVVLPDGPYETVAGFVMDELGEIPAPGARVSVGPLDITVLRREGLRVTELLVRPRPGGSA
jgi:CBS domain containing-hemolysin-like protein